MNPSATSKAIDLIRLALPGDAVAIALVLYESFAEYKPAYTPAAFAATTPTSDVVAARLKEGPVWVAVWDGAIVGTVSAVPRGQAVYVRSPAVRPAAREAAVLSGTTQGNSI